MRCEKYSEIINFFGIAIVAGIMEQRTLLDYSF